MLDLFGTLEVVSVHASNETTLPSGKAFYRHWTITATVGKTVVLIDLSFISGFAEQLIHVRGSLASATVDLESNTYIIKEHTAHGLDFDRYSKIRREAKSLATQARRGLTQYVLSKLKLSREGSPYGSSIARAISSFYGSLETVGDQRISPTLGRGVINLCSTIARMGSTDKRVPSPDEISNTQVSTKVGAKVLKHPEILVLGATGFIGQELTRQLVEGGNSVRLLARNPGKLPQKLLCKNVEITRGDVTCKRDLEAAMSGCRYVYHLARCHAKTWREFQRQEIDVTRMVAETCLVAGIERLIYTGTIDSYYAGRKAGTITEATPLDEQIERRNLYARSKAASEEILLTLHRDQNLPIVIFRPGIVLGKGGSPFHWGVGMWCWNAVCRVWGRGEHPLPFVLVQDVAQALLTALHTPGIEGESFNLVAESGLSARGYLQALEACSGVCFQKYPTPPWRFYMEDIGKWVIKQLIRHPDRRRPSYRDWETRTQRAHYDCTKARHVLAWNPVSDPEEFLRLGVQEPCAAFLA
jgi:nucleoside-diphosphate-sugar epimerase